MNYVRRNNTTSSVASDELPVRGEKSRLIRTGILPLVGRRENHSCQETKLPENASADQNFKNDEFAIN